MTTYSIVAWDNIYTNERLCKKVNSKDVSKFIEALNGQGCPAGFWSLEYWDKVQAYVMSGKYKFKEIERR